MFLEHKNAEITTENFLFYIIGEHDEIGFSPKGYFSKVKLKK